MRSACRSCHQSCVRREIGGSDESKNARLLSILWIGVEQGTVRIHAEAPREAPTVRGFVGFLIEALEGVEATSVAGFPADLLERMGLAEVLSVVRSRGLGAVVQRMRRDVARALAERVTT